MKRYLDSELYRNLSLPGRRSPPTECNGLHTQKKTCLRLIKYHALFFASLDSVFFNEVQFFQFFEKQLTSFEDLVITNRDNFEIASFLLVLVKMRPK